MVYLIARAVFSVKSAQTLSPASTEADALAVQPPAPPKQQGDVDADEADRPPADEFGSDDEEGTQKKRKVKVKPR